MSKSYEATLVRGETYYLGERRFDKGKPQIVTLVEKKKLEDRAVDRFTSISGDQKEITEKPKFKFKEVEEKAKPKADKAAELAAMQGDGGVGFEEDEEESEDEAGEETEGDEGEGDEAPAKAPAGRKSSQQRPVRRR